MMMKTFLRSIIVVLSIGIFLSGILIACNRADETRVDTAEQSSPATAKEWFPLRIGDTPLRAQIVLTPNEQARGLMFRTVLDTNDGMLFPFRTPRKMRFWMRNTPLPLDIGFFTPDGVLREVYQMQPYDETGISSRSQHLQLALEMNQGWFAMHGIRPGARLDLELLANALRARGADPDAFLSKD